MSRKTVKNIEKTFRPLIRMKKARAMKAVLAKKLREETTKASILIKPNKKIPRPVQKEAMVEDNKISCSDINHYHDLLNVLPRLVKEQKLSIFEYMPEMKDIKFLSVASVFSYALMKEAKLNNVKRVSKKFALEMYNKFDWILPFEVFWATRKKLNIDLIAARRCRKKAVDIDLCNDYAPTAFFYRPTGSRASILLPKVCPYYGTLRERRYLRKKIIEIYMNKKYDDPTEYKKIFLFQKRDPKLNEAIKEADKYCPENTITAYRLSRQIELYRPQRYNKPLKNYKERFSRWGFYRRNLHRISMSYRAYIALKNGEDSRAEAIFKTYCGKKEVSFDEMISFYLEGVAEDSVC